MESDKKYAVNFIVFHKQGTRAIICNFTLNLKRGMKSEVPFIFYILVGISVGINLLQGYFTELIYDEAYYWYYAQEMAWGYFDHPPMVAFLVKISSLFFNGELGVRFAGTLLSAGMLFVLWDTIDSSLKRKFLPHFFVLVFSMPLLHAYGFLTLPDTPLLFFTALFLWVYKKFLQKPNLVVSSGLGVVMAALMYSKYHAILIILCVLLSNPRLVLRKYAWLAVVVSIVCYFPHLNWLYQNDFISLKYHLYERPNGAYDFSGYTLGYFLNLITLFGFTFPWIYLGLFKSRPKDIFQRALLFIVYGILIFFFISSFNRRIQTQWLIAVCVPVVLIVFNYLVHSEGSRKWIFRVGIANILILGFLRIGLIYEPLFPIVYESHGNKEWVTGMAEMAGSKPVVFENSYRNAPMYAFYSGHPSYSLNTIRYRQNQYSLNDSEADVQHRSILYVTDYYKKTALEFPMPDGGKNYGIFMEDFESFRQLRCVLTSKASYPGEQNCNFSVYNPYDQDIAIEKLDFGIAYLNEYRQVTEISSLNASSADKHLMVLKSKDSTQFVTDLPMPELPHPSYMKLTISENGLYWGLNGMNQKIP